MIARDDETGIAIRFVKQYVITRDTQPRRDDWVWLAPDEEEVDLPLHARVSDTESTE